MNVYFKKGAAFLGVLVLAAVVAVPAHASTDPYYMSPWMPVPTYPLQYQYQYQPQVQIPTQTQTQYQSQYQYIFYLLQLINQLQAQLSSLGGGYYDDTDRSGDSEIEITTRSATNIKDDEARLRGTIDFNDSDYAYIWFEYGEDNDDLDEDTPHIKLDDSDDEDFSSRVTDLDEDQKYYFRAVGEDEDGERDYGSVKSFTTDENGNNNNGDEPDVETGDADNVTDDSVELNGEIDMNDFENGIVFFVYGEDEDQIDDVESDYDTYSDVDENGDNLQKVKVDSDLDGSSDYSLDIDGLDNDTEYFYSICVEYEDEDDDDTLACGSTESFETDN